MRDPVSVYARSVVAGKVLAGRLVRLACERHLRDRAQADKRKGAKARTAAITWDAERAENALGFFPEVLRLESGKPFVLEPFQEFVVGSLFGWYLDGFRRFRTAYVEQGKGSGKTPMAAGLGIYGMVADGEPAAEVYSAATTADQASIAWRDARRMVEASPELRGLIKVEAHALSIPDQHSVFRPVSAEHRGLDGKRVHMAIIDELHEHPSPLVVDKMRAGTKNRRNALLFEITNSGFDRTSVCWAHHDYSTKVLEGSVQNDAWFAYVCSLDPGDDWRDERVWPKANPGIGVTLPISYLREQVREAEGMRSKEGIVRRLNFCQWTEQRETWLAMDAWAACVGEVDEAALAGRECWAGIAGASADDVFAFVLVFPEADGLKVVCRFWLPEDVLLPGTPKARGEADRLMLRGWADAGHLKLTPGGVTDYDAIERDIVALFARFDVREVAASRGNITQLLTHLRDEMGDEERVVDVPQSYERMSAPAKELDRIVKDARLHHGGHPVLAWMASNTAIKAGPNELVKPERGGSDPIDGITALVLALGRLAMAAGEREDEPWDGQVMVLS